MKISRWILRVPDFHYNSNVYKTTEIDSINNFEDKFVIINLSERNIEPKCHAQIILSPLESFKFGCNLICAGILGLREQSKHGTIPSPLQMKGFDACIFTIKEILDKRSAAL
jgi:hypothetical protein